MMTAPWLLVLSVCSLFGYIVGCAQRVHPRPDPLRVTCRYAAGATPVECGSFQPCVGCVTRFGNYYQQCDRCNGNDPPSWYNPLPHHLKYQPRVCIRSKSCLTCPICKHPDSPSSFYNPYLGCDGCNEGDNYVPGN